jgi:hypothetical protein
VETGWNLLSTAVTAAVSALGDHNGLGVAVTSLISLGMLLVFVGWVVTRPNTGSFKFGPRGMEWRESAQRESPTPPKPEGPVPKRRRWQWRKHPPDSS